MDVVDLGIELSMWLYTSKILKEEEIADDNSDQKKIETMLTIAFNRNKKKIYKWLLPRLKILYNK